jgi:undecaprenyl phosphate-alpha-L-ara4N flippase subunit ArnF
VSRAPHRRLGLLLALVTIVLSAAGQLAMKMGMQTLHALTAAQGQALTLDLLLASRPVMLWTACGLGAYAVSLLCWLAVLVRFPLSYAYPLLSLTYVLVYLGATRWPALMEPVTATRSIGTVLIIAGVALVAATAESAPHRS